MSTPTFKIPDEDFDLFGGIEPIPPKPKPIAPYFEQIAATKAALKASEHKENADPFKAFGGCLAESKTPMPELFEIPKI
jgi:hypothetical protein